MEFCLWTRRKNTSPNLGLGMGIDKAEESFSKEVISKQGTKGYRN